MATYINIDTGCIATPEEILEWEEYNRNLSPHNYAWQCDCRQCKGEKYKEE